MKINNELVKVVGIAGLRIGKDIIIEGTKAVLFKTAVATVKQSYNGGVKSVKEMTLTDILKDKKDPEAKGLLKKLFTKKKGEELIVDFEDGSEMIITEVEEV